MANITILNIDDGLVIVRGDSVTAQSNLAVEPWSIPLRAGIVGRLTTKLAVTVEPWSIPLSSGEPRFPSQIPEAAAWSCPGSFPTVAIVPNVAHEVEPWSCPANFDDEPAIVVNVPVEVEDWTCPASFPEVKVVSNVAVTVEAWSCPSSYVEVEITTVLPDLPEMLRAEAIFTMTKPEAIFTGEVL